MRWTPIVVMAVMLPLLAAGQARGDLYVWTEADGVKHFSNVEPTGDVAEQQMETEGDVDGTASSGFQRGARAPRPKIVMFTSPRCGYCRLARDFFERHGLRYTEYDIAASRKGRLLFKRYRGRGVPLILIGDKRIEGFNEPAIRKLLNIR